ncbi:glutaredoxin [Methylomonas lenta]|uniref:Glutaredoxin n=1 Tax=Methylomonas lenta TaxID=980561 RepID=A0A177NIL6_9GAMM|nr:glutaredoxin family protein [Methylomonas lenta]OAI17293.1 glutaredoxin [Methylomonas lenta]
MSNFVLFGTEGCHLCEDAEHLLLQAGLNFEIQDIINNDKAMQRYAIRIPVLVHTPSELELSWPFNAEQLQDFISQL